MKISNRHERTVAVPPERIAPLIADRGCSHNGTAMGDSGLNPVALPPMVAPMWGDHQRMFL
jgi:hypothetical protein